MGPPVSPWSTKLAGAPRNLKPYTGFRPPPAQRRPPWAAPPRVAAAPARARPTKVPKSEDVFVHRDEKNRPRQAPPVPTRTSWRNITGSARRPWLPSGPTQAVARWRDCTKRGPPVPPRAKRTAPKSGVHRLPDAGRGPTAHSTVSRRASRWAKGRTFLVVLESMKMEENYVLRGRPAGAK